MYNEFVEQLELLYKSMKSLQSATWNRNTWNTEQNIEYYIFRVFCNIHIWYYQFEYVHWLIHCGLIQFDDFYKKEPI